MTLTDLLPVRLGLFDRTHRPARKHRAPDEIERQRALRAGADLLIKGLRLQLEEQEARHAQTIARIDERHDEIVRSLQNQVADLERRLDVRRLAEAVVTRTQPIPVITPVPLHESPQAVTDPGRVPPSWARRDEPNPAA